MDLLAGGIRPKESGKAQESADQSAYRRDGILYKSDYLDNV
nr:MAG TPA: hypothetical protein [Caudoviricetes sp.]